jgi:FlaG/FlaF family flagellin (archaellin)
MKIGGSKKKKAVSAVVATILIVMITVLAIGIIWVTILPMIRENLAVSDVCENAGVSIISSQGYTCYKPQNITMVQVSKSNSEVNVTGLIFSISSSGNSYDYNEQEVAYSTNDYNVYYLNTSEFEKIEKISVVPVVKSGDSEKSCSALSLDNIPLCSANINLVAVSAGKLIGRSSGYATNVPEVTPACVSNNSCAQNICTNVNCTDSCGNNHMGIIKPNCSCAENILFEETCKDGCGGTCNGELGMACVNKEDCLSGYCRDSVCTTNGEFGSACLTNNGCVSERCSNSGSKELVGVCLKKNWDLCSQNSECFSDLCHNGECYPDSRCVDNTDCSGGACNSGYCIWY